MHSNAFSPETAANLMKIVGTAECFNHKSHKQHPYLIETKHGFPRFSVVKRMDAGALRSQFAKSWEKISEQVNKLREKKKQIETNKANATTQAKSTQNKNKQSKITAKSADKKQKTAATTTEESKSMKVKKNKTMTTKTLQTPQMNTPTIAEADNNGEVSDQIDDEEEGVEVGEPWASADCLCEGVKMYEEGVQCNCCDRWYHCACINYDLTNHSDEEMYVCYRCV